ncbi:hypothetical protein ACWCPT_35410, partial [Streptomyces sp. NPDC002308]
APANAGLRAQLKEGSPLLTENLLRTLLRAPNVPGMAAHHFSQPGTAAAGPQNKRRIFADMLARNSVMRSVAFSDLVARELAYFNAEVGEALNGIAGIEEALRTDGRLGSLVASEPFAMPLLRRSPSTLDALLRNDGALLQLTLATRHVAATLHESPELLTHLVDRPALLRTLSQHQNSVTPSPHWARLFEDTGLLTVLESEDGLALVRALASNPDLLTDALARDTFLENVKEGENLRAYLALSQSSAKEFARTVRAMGEVSITSTGIPVEAGPARLARAILDEPERIPEVIEQLAAPQDRGRYLRTAAEALHALKELKELRGAVGREFGIILAMLQNGEMTPTLLKRPALIGLLADRTKSAMKALYDRPVLTRGLRENGRLYLRFLHVPALAQTLASPTFAHQADAMGRNRDYIRAFEIRHTLPGALRGDRHGGLTLLMASEAISGVVADDPQIRAGIGSNPYLVNVLANLFHLNEGRQRAEGRAWQAAESTARAVVSSVVMVQALAERPERIKALVISPALSHALTENPGVLRTGGDAAALLENEPLVETFRDYPRQASVVLRTPGLLPLVARTPELVGAMESSEQLTALLERDEGVRALLGEQPEVAQDLVRTPALVPVLGGLPRLVQAMRDGAGIARRLRADPGLLPVLRARRTLVDDLAGDT